MGRDQRGQRPKPDEVDEHYSCQASGGERGRQSDLFRVKAAADWLGCSVFDLLEKPAVWIEFAIEIGNVTAEGDQEWAKVQEFLGRHG